MKTEQEILNDYYKLNNFESVGFECDYYIKKTFDFQAYQCSVRWKEFKSELFNELKKIFCGK